ncbi:MAG TPA: hypothetical protein VGF94_21630 [Kofleriaceae bacterium]
MARKRLVDAGALSDGELRARRASGGAARSAARSCVLAQQLDLSTIDLDRANIPAAVLEHVLAELARHHDPRALK